MPHDAAGPPTGPALLTAVPAKPGLWKRASAAGPRRALIGSLRLVACPSAPGTACPGSVLIQPDPFPAGRGPVHGGSAVLLIDHAPQGTPELHPQPLVSVVLPTLNEAGNIGPLLREITAALEGVAHEIIVVDDGSSDGTVEEVRLVRPDACIVQRVGRRGLASAVAEGFDVAAGTYLIVMDSDGQHPAGVLRSLIREAEGTRCDLVVASRFVAGGSGDAFPLARRLVSRAARDLAWLAVRAVRTHRITDATGGFFLVRRDAVRAGDLEPHGFKILLEVLVRGDIGRVREVPYVFGTRTRGKSKLSQRVVADYVRHLASLARSDHGNRRATRKLSTFATAGLLGTFVNLGVLGILTHGLGVAALPAALVAIEASVVHNFAWNDGITFRDSRRRGFLSRFGRFHLACAAGLVLNLATFSALVFGAGANVLAAELVAISAGFVANFAGARWALGKRGEPESGSGSDPRAGRDPSPGAIRPGLVARPAARHLQATRGPGR